MAHTTPVAARSLRRDRSHPPYTGMSRLSDFACPLLIDDSLRPSAWVQTRAASVLRGAVANTAVVDGFSPYMEQTSSPAGWSQKFRIAHKPLKHMNRVNVRGMYDRGLRHLLEV